MSSDFSPDQKRYLEGFVSGLSASRVSRAGAPAKPEPVGPENDAWLARLGADAGIRVAAWGVDGSHLGRDAAALALIPDLRCLGLTKDGFPRHPLRLRRDTPPVAF